MSDQDTVYVSVPMSRGMCDDVDRLARLTHRSRAGMIRHIIKNGVISERAALASQTPFTDALRVAVSTTRRADTEQNDD